MCYEAPGPRCSGHTRINFRKAKANLVEATADLKAKHEALQEAQDAESLAALQASEMAHANAVRELNEATEKYEASKAKRAVAMDAYRKAKDEYNASPEGIKKNRLRSANPALTPDQREQAHQDAIEGNAVRNRQKEAYEFKKALEEVEAQNSIADLTSLTSAAKVKLASTSKNPKELQALIHTKHIYSDDAYDTKLNIARNPYADADTLDTLARVDGDGEFGSESIHDSIANHDNASPETLRHIAGGCDGDGNNGVAVNLVENKNTPSDVRADVMRKYGANDYFQTVAARSATVPIQDIESMAHAGNEHAVANPRLPLSTLKEIHSKTGNPHVAGNPNCPPAIIESVVRSGSWVGLRHAAANEKTPEAVLHELAKEDDGSLRDSLLMNNNSPVGVWKSYAKQGDTKARYELASHWKAPTQFLAELRQVTKSARIREAIDNNLSSRSQV